MPPIKTYTIKSYDGSETLFSTSNAAAVSKILPTGISIGDGDEWTYTGDKTFVGVSWAANATRCEFGIGSGSFFPENLTVYIYEQDSPVLPHLLNYSSNKQYGTLKLNGEEIQSSVDYATNYRPIYENDILTFEESAHQSGSEYYVYYPAINGQVWRNDISLGGEDIAVTSDIIPVKVAEGFSYKVTATYFNDSIGEKNTIWIINTSISTSLTRTMVKFKSNNSDWEHISSSNNYLYFGFEYTYTPVYDPTTGWEDEVYRTIEFEQPIWDDELRTWLQANAVKLSTPRKSVDLSTLSGWAGLASGAHSIRVKAKATGYKDSELSQAVSVTKGLAPKALEDCTWEEISQVSANKQWDAMGWQVGDAKTITLNGTVGTVALNNYQCKVYILGFDHNADKEGTGISFSGFKTTDATKKDVCLVDGSYGSYSSSTTSYTLNPASSSSNSTNSGGWKKAKIRKNILGSTDVENGDATAAATTNPVANTLMAALPADLRAVLKPITKYTDNAGNKSTAASSITPTVDYLPLMAEFEVFGTRSYANTNEQTYQAQYQYYKNGKSKVKYKHSDVTTAARWWLRSPNASSSASFCGVNGGGGANYDGSGYSYGLAPAFLV